MKFPISKKRQKQIDEFNKSEFKAGEYVSVLGKYIDALHPEKPYTCSIDKVEGDVLLVRSIDYSYKQLVTLRKVDVLSRGTRHIGADPFVKERKRVQPVQFSLESVIHTLDLQGKRLAEKQENHNGIPLMECNWNPFIYLGPNKEKQYYQRPFVWKTEQKKALVSSIYNGVDCGKILVRQRSYEEVRQMADDGETELAYHDIVDGKQRLGAVVEFLNDEFKDAYGNHFSDLSDNAQNNFVSHQLFSYAFMEAPTDAEVLQQFLRLNFTGVPQSPKHLKFVESLYHKL